MNSTSRGKMGDVQNDSATALPIILVLVAVALVAVVVAAVLGKLTLQGMPAPMKDEIYNPETDGTLTAQSVSAAALPLAFRGYNVDHVDRLLDAAAAAIVARDKKIAELTGEEAPGEGPEISDKNQELIDSVESGYEEASATESDEVDVVESEKESADTDSAELDSSDSDEPVEADKGTSGDDGTERDGASDDAGAK